MNFKPLFKHVLFNSGLKMSIQASETHYCKPRENVGPYYAVEVGYPNARVEALMPYAEDPDSPRETVYGYVPVDVIREIAETCGGIANESELPDELLQILKGPSA